MPRFLDIPDGVHGILEPDHDTQGRHEQQNDPDDGGEAPGLLRAGAGQHGFDRLAAGLTEQGAELLREACAGGIRPEEEARHAGDDQQERPHREHGVVGKRGAQSGAPMPEPLVNRSLENFQDHSRSATWLSSGEPTHGRRVSADVSIDWRRERSISRSQDSTRPIAPGLGPAQGEGLPLDPSPIVHD